MSDSKLIVVAGNIGVGKTTLLGLLQGEFGWDVYFEPQAKNPYIADFYDDMRRWAYHSQIFFLTERFKDHIKIQNSSKISLQDRSIYEDAEIFATNLYSRELMPERDYGSYMNLYKAMVTSLKTPDLVIYLKASAWTLISRIRKRGRDYERDIDREYLAQLNIGYDNWIKKISGSWNVMVIDTDNFDIEVDKDWLEGIIVEVGERVKKL